jgi:hypothetical protein
MLYRRGWLVMPLLERYVARNITVSAGELASWSTGLVEAEQQARLSREATAWPRRLGQDASAAELARDKKLARRMRHAFLRVLDEWGGDTEMQAGPQDELRRAAAVMQWDAYVQNHQRQLEALRAGVATYAHAAGERKWGNRAVHLFTMELEAVRYASR